MKACDRCNGGMSDDSGEVCWSCWLKTKAELRAALKEIADLKETVLALSRLVGR